MSGHEARTRLAIAIGLAVGLGCSRTPIAGSNPHEGASLASDVPALPDAVSPQSPPPTPAVPPAGQPGPPIGRPPTPGNPGIPVPTTPPPPPPTWVCDAEVCELPPELPAPLERLIPRCCTEDGECGIRMMTRNSDCLALDQPGTRDPTCDEGLAEAFGQVGLMPSDVSGCCKPSGECGVDLFVPLGVGCVERSELFDAFGADLESLPCGDDPDADAGLD